MDGEWADQAAAGEAALASLIGSDAWPEREAHVVGLLAGAGGGDEDVVRGRLAAFRAELTPVAGRGGASDAGPHPAELPGWLRRLLSGDLALTARLRTLAADAPPPGPVPAGGNTVSGGVIHGPVIQAASIGQITFAPPMSSAQSGDVPVFQVPSLAFSPVDHVPYMRLFDRYLGEPATTGSWVGYLVLGGLPGLGKTTLACRWAGENRGLFPDGQLYVDFEKLRKEGRPGGDVHAALAHCLRALGVEDGYLPDGLDELAKLYRQRTSGRRMLVVLEDVSQPAQVSELLPAGTGSALLVTSAGKLGELSLDGARLVPLEPLEDASALEMLADLCGAPAVAAEPEAARRLVTLCAGVPLALRLVAARLLTKGGLTMARLAMELGDERRRLAGMSLRRGRSVSAALGLVYAALPSEQARLYRLLGWLPGRAFDSATAAVAAHLEVETAQLLLSGLEEVNLVDVTEDDRYRMHDLVRLHAQERARAEEAAGEQLALITRVTEHYLALTSWADRTIRADRLRRADVTDLLGRVGNAFAVADGPVPLDWLDAERATIMAVLREAFRRGLDELVGPLAESFSVLFLHHRYLDDWRESLETGADAAAAARDAGLEARLRSLLSRPLMDLGRYDEAHAQLQRAVGRAQDVDDRALRASVQEFLGRYYDRTDPARAVAAYQRCLDLNTEAQEWRGVALARYFLGCAQDAAGRSADALTTLRGVRRAFLEFAEPDLRMAARVKAAIGLAQAHLGERDAAVETLEEAVEDLHAANAHHYEAQALQHLADTAEAAHASRETVRAYLTRALGIHQAAGSPAAETLRERIGRLDGAADDTGERDA